MNYFIAICLILFLVIAARNLRWAVFLILALLPSYLIRFELLGIPMTALEAMILIIFLVWLFKNFQFSIYNFQSIFKFSIFKQYKLLIISCFLFLISATVGMFVSPDLREAAGIWKAYFIEPILFFVVLISEFRGAKDFKFIVSALSISAFYISIYAILQRFFGAPIPAPWQLEMRITSIFSYPNAVGLFLAPIVPLLLAIVIPAKAGIQKIQPMDSPIKLGNDRVMRIFLLLVCVLSVFSIYFAKTEAALVALAAGLFFFLLFYNKKTRLVLILFIILLSVFSFLFLASDLFVSIQKKLLFKDWSGFVRTTMWSETWQMLKDRPIFGAGLAGYQTAILPYHKAQWMEIFLYPHNIIFNFWSELGLSGLISFVAIVILFFWNLFGNCKLSRRKVGIPTEASGKIENLKDAQSHRGLLLVMVSSMIVLLVHGLVDVPYFKNDLSVLFWTIIALPIIVKNDKLV